MRAFTWRSKGYQRQAEGQQGFQGPKPIRTLVVRNESRIPPQSASTVLQAGKQSRKMIIKRSKQQQKVWKEEYVARCACSIRNTLVIVLLSYVCACANGVCMQHICMHVCTYMSHEQHIGDSCGGVLYGQKRPNV